MKAKWLIFSALVPAIVAALLAVACGEDAERDEAGNVVGAGDVDAFDLRAGDCFNDADNESEEFDTLRVVPCSEPHDNEIYASVVHPADGDAPFPGVDAMYEFGEPECLEAFEEFVGIGYDESEFVFDLIYPLEAGWEDFGDRVILCYLWQWELEKIEGSVKGTRR